MPATYANGYLDEVVLTIHGKRHYLWCAVDKDSLILVVLVKGRHDKKSAKRLLQKLPKKQGEVPRVMVIDKLESCFAVKRETIAPSSTA